MPKKPLCKSMQLKPHERQVSPGEQNSSDEDDGTKSGQDEQTQSNFKIDTGVQCNVILKKTNMSSAKWADSLCEMENFEYVFIDET